MDLSIACFQGPSVLSGVRLSGGLHQICWLTSEELHCQPQYCTHRLQCSSVLVMTYFLLREYNVLPRKELYSSLWIQAIGTHKIKVIRASPKTTK